MSDSLLTNIGIMIFLLGMSAYFSASETAFSSINRTRMKTLAEKGARGAKLAFRLSEEYDRLLSTILIGNNIVVSHKHHRAYSSFSLPAKENTELIYKL